MLKGLPYTRLKAILDAIKKRYYTRDWPDAPTLYVGESPEQLEQRLRQWHFEGLYLSYKYAGQEVDLRRPEGINDNGTPLEVHIRARWDESTNMLGVIGHIEACRYESKHDHINATHLRWLSNDELRGIVVNGETLL